MKVEKWWEASPGPYSSIALGETLDDCFLVGDSQGQVFHGLGPFETPPTLAKNIIPKDRLVWRCITGPAPWSISETGDFSLYRSPRIEDVSLQTWASVAEAPERIQAWRLGYEPHTRTWLVSLPWVEYR